MGEENTAWFEADAPAVEGFTKANCPHGFLAKVQGDESATSYRCSFCTAYAYVVILGADEDEAE